VIAVIAMLAAMLFPALAQTREKARSVGCLSNQKQIACALLLYAQDHDEQTTWFFNAEVAQAEGNILAGYWFWQLHPYLRSRDALICPSVGPWTLTVDTPRGPMPDYRRAGYGYNYAHVAGREHRASKSLAQFGRPAETMYIADSGVLRPGEERWGFQDIKCCAGKHPNVPEIDYYNSFPHNAFCAVSDRHAGGAHAVFMDGHAKWYRRERILERDPATGLWGHYSAP
jgi:prepilin-type processing-associated H-X9-DG protein